MLDFSATITYSMLYQCLSTIELNQPLQLVLEKLKDLPLILSTLSCNDLHWKDMKRGLLVSDGKQHIDPDDIDIQEIQRLIEMYPVVVSRHFMVRVNALMQITRLFATPEGIARIDSVCSTAIPPETSELYKLVKNCQIHRHTNSEVSRAIQQIRREETDVSRKMFKICMRILRERQVSACECVFRLCHLSMRDSSRKTIFVNTRKAEQRYKVLKFNEAGQAAGYCANIFERYEKRPAEHPPTMILTICV
ncbi:hypothetical protein ACJJTC_014266 [Scirpophaga incertulas]